MVEGRGKVISEQQVNVVARLEGESKSEIESERENGQKLLL